MKLSTVAALLAAAATSAVASPVILEDVGSDVEARGADNNKHYPACDPAGPGSETNQAVLATTQHYFSGGRVSDVGADSLFSYSRPTEDYLFGILTIADPDDHRRIIEFRSGSAKTWYSINPHKECRVQLRVTAIDHYRVWVY